MSKIIKLICSCCKKKRPISEMNYVGEQENPWFNSSDKDFGGKYLYLFDCKNCKSTSMLTSKKKLDLVQ